MLLLLVLFPDLKEFDFWGLRGNKAEKDLGKLKEEKAIPPTTEDSDKKQVTKAERNNPVQLMDNARGNFLALAFDTERLLRIFATVNLGKATPPNISPFKLTQELKDKGFLTENGTKQLEAIRWLSDILVQGREQEINPATLSTGIEIAYSFYKEIYNWLYPENPIIETV